MKMIRIAAVLVALSGLGAACGGPPAVGKVPLSNTWPAQPGEYDEVTARWTRHAILRAPGQQALEVYATLASPAWRAAHATHRAKVERLTPAAHAALMASEQQAATEGPYEVALLVTTHDRRENDLNKGPRSVWRVVLTDGQGNALEPVEIKRDRRPPGIVAAELPHLTDFAVPYVARFPRDLELFGPDAERIVLKISSPRGAVELVWEDP